METQLVEKRIGQMMRSIMETDSPQILMPDLKWARTLSSIPTPSVWQLEKHPFDEIAFVTNGACAMVLGDRAHEVTEGGICIIPPGEPHYESPISPNEPYSILWIKLSAPRLVTHAGHYAPDQRQIERHSRFNCWIDDDITQTLHAIYREVKAKQAFMETVLQGHLLTLTGLIQRQCHNAEDHSLDRHPNDVIRSAAEFIEDNLDQPDLNVPAISQHVAFDNCYFTEYFKRHTGYSPYQYVLQRRMERACRLLLATDLTVTHIAEEVGFSSPYHFSTTFKKYNGVPPSQYRRPT